MLNTQNKAGIFSRVCTVCILKVLHVAQVQEILETISNDDGDPKGQRLAKKLNILTGNFAIV